jgi:hypothetical protein
MIHQHQPVFFGCAAFSGHFYNMNTDSSVDTKICPTDPGAGIILIVEKNNSRLMSITIRIGAKIDTGPVSLAV